MAHSTFPMDTSALATNLGGWWKRLPPAGDGDELLAFATIAEDVPAYDASLYASPEVSTLIVRQKSATWPQPFVLATPDGGAVSVRRIEGEIVERTSQTLLVRWRDIETSPGFFDAYQRAAYALRPDDLAVRWSDLAPSAAAASAPALAASDACGSPGVDCYGHEPLAGW